VFDASRDAAVAEAEVEACVAEVDEDGSVGGAVMDAGRGAMSLKTCLGSRNFGSICFGAINSRQTTKISADTFLVQCQQLP